MGTEMEVEVVRWGVSSEYAIGLQTDFCLFGHLCFIPLNCHPLTISKWNRAVVTWCITSMFGMFIQVRISRGFDSMTTENQFLIAKGKALEVEKWILESKLVSLGSTSSSKSYLNYQIKRKKLLLTSACTCM